MVFHISNASALSQCQSLAERVDQGAANPTGRLVIYSGAVPADADAPLGGASELASMSFALPAFGLPTDQNPGALAASNPLTPDPNAAGGAGPVAFFRMLDRDDVSVAQGTAGIAGTDLITSTATIPAGAIVSVDALSLFVPES